ncbi:ISAzo13 family transposase, partial [Candidatus Magnetobacterium casense]|uniref:ISAzo13 family transposase n=5 Tax=Candidatus Magnetobacterium casense TaxID=1455061 RepID=UPI0005903F50
KIREGSDHPDRDAQFRYINEQVVDFQQRQEPVISVDTKKKELVGDFKNAGREWQPMGQPDVVRDHDFADKELGKVNPYGVYDQGANIGWVSVGTDNDTSEFAVESIRRWWRKMGCEHYPNAKTLLITADCGGSNGYRVRLWKVALQRFANETGLNISVCHFPPGTSKWNKIEHRMFCHISMNWRGKPLTSHEIIVNLIGSTTTNKGLKIKAELDTTAYSKGIKVSDEEFDKVNLTKASFHGEWNYTIAPNCSS